MKILHIIRSVNPEGGGPIEGVKQLSGVLTADKIEILSLDDPDAAYLNDSGLTIHAVGAGLGKYGFSRQFIPWLAAHAQDYDVFIVNGIWQYHSFAAHHVLKKLNKPYFLFTHGMLDPWFKHTYPLKHLKKSLYWPWFEYPVVRDAKQVCFTCEEERVLASQSFRLYRCNEVVVGYGTAGHTGDADAQRRLFLEHYPQLRDQRFLLYLSRIHPKKGVDLLIEAFAQASPDQPDLQLVIAGPDQIGWQAKLEPLAEKLGVADKITWTGMLQGDLKWGAYLSAEAFILPSHQENFGIVVAEALSCSLPVLISNKVNIWREIAEDKAGLVAEDTRAGCVKLLSDWLKSDETNRAQMRDNAKQCFLTRFEISSVAQNIREVWSAGL